MSPRPVPDLAARRRDVARAARDLASLEGWSAVTMRRLASDLGVTQPVLYTAFSGRQELIDAVAVDGFDDLATTLAALEPSPAARMRGYLDFAEGNPRIYEVMFSLPSGLVFAADETPEPLRRAFDAVRAAFPAHDVVRAEVAWSALHGLATLQAAERLPADLAQARFELLHRMLTAE